MTGWKVLRAGISLAVTACAATFALPHKATADPVTPYLGFAVDGTCVAGTCSPSVLTSGSASLSYDGDVTLANGDIFQVDANLTATPISAGGSGVSPVSVAYIGDGHGGTSLPGDTITTDIYKAFTLTSPTTLSASVSGDFGGGIASRSTAAASVNGTSLGSFPSDNGAFSSPAITVGSVPTGTLDIDRQYTSTFAGASPTGSYILYNGASAPSLPLTIPAPPLTLPSSCASDVAGAVHVVTVNMNGGTNNRIEATFIPNNGISLSQAESDCGVLGFDWTQTINKVPQPNSLNLVSPTPDPPKGGLPNYEAGDISDNYPFYYSINPARTDALSIQCHESPLPLDISCTNPVPFPIVPPNGVTYADQPTIGVPTGTFLEFTTDLVGLVPGSGNDSAFGYQPSAPFFQVTWIDYPSTGPITQLAGDSFAGDGGGSIVILDETSEINPISAPEPPSWEMLSFGSLILLALMTVKNMRNQNLPASKHTGTKAVVKLLQRTVSAAEHHLA